MKALPRLSFGVGDRFAHEAEAQLAAFEKLAAAGVVVAPVWNKSNREHSFIGSAPASVRDAAARAVAARNWPHPWFVDADHIRLETVDRFLAASDFFTIDVADSIGGQADAAAVAAFSDRRSPGSPSRPGSRARPWRRSCGSISLPAARRGPSGDTSRRPAATMSSSR
jgi:hypothetical protein